MLFLIKWEFLLFALFYSFHLGTFFNEQKGAENTVPEEAAIKEVKKTTRIGRNAMSGSGSPRVQKFPVLRFFHFSHDLLMESRVIGSLKGRHVMGCLMPRTQ